MFVVKVFDSTYGLLTWLPFCMDENQTTSFDFFNNNVT